MTSVRFLKKRSFLTGPGLDRLIRTLFGANALAAIIILALITLFLFREGLGFFPQNLRNLQVYRLAGLEYVDFIRDQVEAHTALSRELQEIRLKELQRLLKEGRSLEEANASLAAFDAAQAEFSGAIVDLRGLLSDLSDAASAIKEKAKVNEDMASKRQQLLAAGKEEEARAVQIQEIDFRQEVAAITGVFPMYQETSRALASKLQSIDVPARPNARAQSELARWKQAAAVYVAGFPAVEERLKSWNQMEPVPWYRTISAFLLGRNWITNSFWQDWYGVIPLLIGSVLVSLVALVFAIPLGVCSAIYVSEIASAREQRFIKPCIEFISAIPSVVLGFFGIALLGETIRTLTEWEWLQWVPFFPISERLNIFTAGLLLGLMAVPTIFSLSEDALNNVPRAFKEASYALGATRVQTIVKILVPASLSGIISAVLLGFGRVIGETMVVLLCAGNRIAIPDFSEGVGAFFQPVHTMTGIIAQEMGEVVQGSIHYRALFMVGSLLFVLSLLINYLAQWIVRRFKISVG